MIELLYYNFFREYIQDIFWYLLFKKFFETTKLHQIIFSRAYSKLFSNSAFKKIFEIAKQHGSNIFKNIFQKSTLRKSFGMANEGMFLHNP